MAPKKPDKEMIAKIKDRLARSRGKGETRSVVSGSIEPVSVSGQYVSIDNWNAIFDTTYNNLSVSATITANSGSISEATIGAWIAQNPGEGMQDEVAQVSGIAEGSLQLSAHTGLVAANPGTVMSIITGTVGPATFYYYQTLDVQDSTS